MIEHRYPRCPIVGNECDDPGCPKGNGCVLNDRSKLIGWVGRHPERKAEFMFDLGLRDLTDDEVGEVPILNEEYRQYCEAEYERWRGDSPENRPGQYMYIWNAGWAFDREERRGRRWRDHIRPLAEKWWLAHGYQIAFEFSGAPFILGRVDNES